MLEATPVEPLSPPVYSSVVPLPLPHPTLRVFNRLVGFFNFKYMGTQFGSYLNLSPSAPTITVRVTSSGATPMVGSMYSLTCTVTRAEGLTDAGAMVTYQWLGAVISDQTLATLAFSPLAISDAGSYTCQATVTSSLLSDPITTASANSESVQPTCRFFLQLYIHAWGHYGT